MSTPQQFSLMALPSELRLQINEHVITNYFDQLERGKPYKGRAANLSILRLDREIHFEVTDIYRFLLKRLDTAMSAKAKYLRMARVTLLESAKLVDVIFRGSLLRNESERRERLACDARRRIFELKLKEISRLLGTVNSMAVDVLDRTRQLRSNLSAQEDGSKLENSAASNGE